MLQTYLANYNASRTLFKRAISIVSWEYFEALAQYWISFERLYGNLDTWEEAHRRIVHRRDELREALKKVC